MAHYIFVVNVRTNEHADPDTNAKLIRDDIQSNLEWFDDIDKVTVREVGPGGYAEAVKEGDN